MRSPSCHGVYNVADYSMRVLLLELSLLVRLVIAIKYDTALRGHAIPVDFYVFKGKDEKTQEQNAGLQIYQHNLRGY